MEPKKSLSALGGLKRTAVPPSANPARGEQSVAEPQTGLVPEATEPAGPEQEPPAAVRTSEPPVAATAQPAEPVETREPKPATAANPKEDRSGGGPGNLTVRGSKVLIQAFEAHKERTRLSFPNVLFNAIDATIDVLPGLLESKRVAVPKANLFGRPETVSLVEEDLSEKHGKAMRISSQHMKVLNDLADKYAGGNRNKLIVTALSEYLKDEIEQILMGQQK